MKTEEGLIGWKVFRILPFYIFIPIFLWRNNLCILVTIQNILSILHAKYRVQSHRWKKAPLEFEKDNLLGLMTKQEHWYQ